MKPSDISIATDLVIFKIIEGEKHILLIQRKNNPYQGQWALPGGFVETDEKVITAAARELQEETSVEVEEKDLRFINFFDEPNRDPRGRIISFAFAAEVPPETRHQAGDDAKEARWFAVDQLPELAFDHKKIIECPF